MRNSTILCTAITLTAVLISVAIAFWGWQVKQSHPVIDEKQLDARIKQSVLAELQSEDFRAAQQETLLAALKNEGIIDDAVEAGIKSYVAKQQNAKRKAQQDLRDGQASGIDGTPGTIILNNNTGAVKLLFGAQPVEALKAAIEQLLN